MSRLEALQQQIADGAARRDIELHCKPMAWEGDIVTHYDSAPRDPELAETIAMAVEYLTIRGRLARHVTRPNSGIVVTVMQKLEEGRIHANSVIRRGVEFDQGFDRFQLSPEQLFGYVIEALQS